MLLSVLFVNAQRNQGTPEEMAQNRVDRMTKQLDLTEDQQSQMYDLVLSQFQNRNANGKANFSQMTQEEKDAFRAERKANQEAFSNGLSEILTADQMAKYKGGSQSKKKGSRGKGNTTRPSRANKANGGGTVAKANRPKKSSDERIQQLSLIHISEPTRPY